MLQVNDRFCAISGYGRDELVGQNHRIINSGHHHNGFFRRMYKDIRAGKTWRVRSATAPRTVPCTGSRRRSSRNSEPTAGSRATSRAASTFPSRRPRSFG
ncbi:PAS domain S-box protein [Methylobacterium persicinum]